MCIVSDELNLRSGAAQAATTALAVQVMQMGCGLSLAIPDVELVGHQPPLRGHKLREGILELAADLTPNSEASIAVEPEQSDLIFVIGDAACNRHGVGNWRLTGTAWTGATGPVGSAATRWKTDFPIGALAAATIAAAEPFKHAVRSLMRPSSLCSDQLAGVPAASATLGDDTLGGVFHLGAIDVVSGGAIVQAFAHALFRIPGIRGNLRVIEPETLDVTNLNRYALARASQVGRPKTEIISSAAPPGLAVEQVGVKLDHSTLQRLAPVSDAVVIGTDDIPSRWTVQSARPRWLGVGATTHFLAMASEHWDGAACARCMHPRDDDVVATIPTVSFVSYWGGLMLAARLLRRAGGGRCPEREQAQWMWALRLDGRHAQPRHRVVPAIDCPNLCASPVKIPRPTELATAAGVPTFRQSDSSTDR